MRLKNLILTTLVCLGIQQTNAQLAPGQIYLPDATPPDVFVNGSKQSLAWSGGFNNPQLATADLNKDATNDLVIFDPAGGIRTFLNESTIPGNPKYIYHPEFALNFPKVNDYMKMLDYNRDGIPDLFHRGFAGVSIYRGYYNAQNQLCFNHYRELYYYMAGSGMVNAYVAPLDIPAIADVDNDGDYDLLSYDIFGTTLTYYRNCEKEDGLPKDSFRVCVKDVCWGRSTQYYERALKLGLPCVQWGLTCKSTESAGKATHSGNTVLMFDYDGDGDYDMLNGNVSFSDIQFLKNGRVELSTAIDSFYWQDTTWGGANGKIMHVASMPNAHYLDIDNDGKKDLVFTPRNENTENLLCMVYYKNTGTPTVPSFSYVTDTLFIKDMIDAGTGARPILYDYNKDGKPDMFVGNEGYYQANGTFRTRIAYYENVSSGTNRAFELKNPDFLGLWSANSRGSYPIIGDLDGDGLDDLLIGKYDGTITYYRNLAASATVQPVWVAGFTLNDQNGTLDVGDNATPFMYDINGDGKKDIVVGSQLGNITYYRNQSSGGSPMLVKVTDSLGGVKIEEYGNLYTYTTPFIGKIDNTGKDYLLVGSKNGVIYKYDSVVSTNLTKYKRIDSFYSRISGYDRATPFVSDFDNDGKYDMFIGTGTGGVVLYKQYFNVGISENMLSQRNVVVFPNPAKNSISISWVNGYGNDANIQVKLVSVTGQLLQQMEVKDKVQTVQMDVSALAQGMYYCIVTSGSNQTVVPVSIIR